MIQVIARDGIPFKSKKVIVKVSTIDSEGIYKEWEEEYEVLIDPLFDLSDPQNLAFEKIGDDSIVRKVD